MLPQPCLEPVTCKDVQRYSRLMRQLSRCMMRGQIGAVDALSMGVEDYEAALTLRVWVAFHEWRGNLERVRQGPGAEHKFLCRSIWNEARLYRRRRSSCLRNLPVVPLADWHFDRDESFEERVMARETLRLLRSKIPEHEWDVLCQIAVAEGDAHRGSSRKDQRNRIRVKKRLNRVSEFLECGIS